MRRYLEWTLRRVKCCLPNAAGRCEERGKFAAFIPRSRRGTAPIAGDGAAAASVSQLKKSQLKNGSPKNQTQETKSDAPLTRSGGGDETGLLRLVSDSAFL